MQTITTFINRIAVTLACFITVGILVHDTKFDRAFSLALPVAAITLGMSSQMLDFHDGAHTHVERVHLKHALSSVPRMHPRDETRRHSSARYSNQGSDFFGGNRILWPSV